MATYSPGITLLRGWKLCVMPILAARAGVPDTEVDEANHAVALIIVIQEDAKEVTVHISDPVATSNLIHRVDPRYPSIAKTARIEGGTVYEVVVGKDGAVSNIRAGSGARMLSQAGIDAIRQWQFKPFLLNGQPVKFSTEATIPFKLADTQ